MEINIFKFESLSDERLTELLTNNESFVIEGIKRRNMQEVTKHLESIMDAQGLKSRVYAKGRKALMAGMAIFTPVTFVTGAVTALTIGVHNVVTWKPDYEIAKKCHDRLTDR